MRLFARWREVSSRSSYCARLCELLRSCGVLCEVATLCVVPVLLGARSNLGVTGRRYGQVGNLSCHTRLYICKKKFVIGPVNLPFGSACTIALGGFP